MKGMRLLVHGGAGAVAREVGAAGGERDYHQALATALLAGHGILKGGGSSLDAVVAAVRVLEDTPLFNAGRGAVMARDGRIELDAAVMDGDGLRAGAVAGVTTLRNPVSAARAVMERSPHVLMIGEGAERFAREAGIETVPPGYFATEPRRAELAHARERRQHGTVGAVAVDANGRLAAATSTGGIADKLPGRVGDSPLIGAGTYADENMAVSATGTGEVYIRLAAAHELAALMRHRGLGVKAAANRVIGQVYRLGGSGGLIAVDRRGRYAMPFCSDGMFRGVIGPKGRPRTAIFT